MKTRRERRSHLATPLGAAAFAPEPAAASTATERCRVAMLRMPFIRNNASPWRWSSIHVVARQVGLGQHEPIGNGNLLDAFGLPVEPPRPVHRIDRRDHIPKTKMMSQHRIGPHRREDREGIGEAGAFNNKPPEWRQQAAFASRMKVFDCRRKLAADRAANAARLQHHHRLVDPFEQMVVKPDLAEFVDQHRGVDSLGSSNSRCNSVVLPEPETR